MMKRLDEFMFLFMMFLFATGWATGWPIWHVVVLVLCIAFVLARSFWPTIKKVIEKKNSVAQPTEEEEK